MLLEKDINYDDEVKELLDLYDKKSLYYQTFNKYNTKEKIIIIEKLINIHCNTSLYYKLSYYYYLYDIIVDIINLLYKDYNIDLYEVDINNLLLKTNLLMNLSSLDKGQILLNKLNNKINYLYSNNLIINYDNLLIISSSHGTIAIFMYWLNKKFKDIENIDYNIFKCIIINSIKNPDDRLFKYFLNNYNIVYDSSLIKDMLHSILYLKIENKLILKKIKLLNYYVDLSLYFFEMIKINNYKLLIDLHKFYYKTEYNFANLNILVVNFINMGELNNIYSILTNILKTEKEKLYLLIILNITYDYISELNININKLEIIINENIDIILDIVDWNNLIYNYNNKIRNDILSIMIKNNYISCYINKYNTSCNHYNYRIFMKIFLFTKFVVVENNSDLKQFIKINKLLHYLRMYIKLKIKNKINNYKIRMFYVFNQIINYNETKYNLFSLKESSLFKIDNNYNFNKFIIRQKSNGLLINKIPLNVYPYTNIFNNIIKAEYIENLNLYLVYDINIPETSFIERYNLLLQNHEYINIKLINNNLYTIDDINTDLNLQKINLNYFLSKTNPTIQRWYPALLCFNNNLENINLIKNHIFKENNDINNLFQNIDYECISLIINSLDDKINNEEIEFKLLNNLDINLKYKFKSWIDNDNIKWNNIINTNLKLNNNDIYSFKYDNNKFIIKDYKYNIFKPDSYENILNIINIHNYIYE